MDLTCISTDGTGYGVMQMQDNATAGANEKFHTTFDRMSQTDNVMPAPRGSNI